MVQESAKGFLSSNPGSVDLEDLSYPVSIDLLKVNGGTVNAKK